jgi:hypothetical protein
LAAAEHKAAVAQIAISAVEKQIDVKQLQLKRLNERQQEFVAEALRDHVEETLGAEYRKRVTDLRDVMQRLWAAQDMVNAGTWNRSVELPGFGLIENERDRKIVPNSAALGPWRELLATWGVAEAA